MLWSEPNPIPKWDSSPNVGLCPTMPEKAAVVAAERDVHFAAGHGRSGARGRPAGHVIMVVRVQGPAVIADAAAGAEAAAQSVHHVLADDRTSGLQNPGNDGCVEVGDEALEGERAEAHGYSRHRDVVLITGGLAGKQTFRFPLDPALPHPGVQRVFF